MPSGIEIVITAKDDASRVMDQVRSKAAGFGQSFQDVERSGTASFTELGRQLERLAVNFTRTLDPAMAGTLARVSSLGTSLTRVAGSAGTVATGIGAGLAAAAGVGVLALSQYIGTLSRLSQEQAKTNQLLAEMDFGGLVGRAKALDQQMAQLQTTFSGWQAVKNLTVGALDQIGAALDRLLGKLPSDLVRRFGTDQSEIGIAGAARADVGAAIRQLLPGQLAQIATAGRITGFQTAGDVAGVRTQQALSRLDIATFLSEMERREQALSNELTERERLIVQQGEARLAAAPPEARPAIEADIRRQREALGSTSAFEQLRAGRRAGATQIGLSLAQGEEDLFRVPAISGTEADAGLAERARQADLARLDIQREMAQVVGAITPELDAQLALAERDLALKQDGLTEAEQVNLELKAQVALLAEMAAMDPLAGLTQGFSEVASRSRQLGSELRAFAEETSANMGRAFSDNFFDLFTGRKGEDIGKRFGESLLRSVSDLLGRQLSGAASGLFATALRSFSSPGAATGGGVGGLLSLILGGATGAGGFDASQIVGSVAGLITSPTGAPAGALVITATGQLAQVAPSGAVIGPGGGTIDPSQVAGILSQANTLSGQLGGPSVSLAGAGTGYLSAVAATPISAIAAQGFSTAVASTQAGLALGFGASAGGTTLTVTGATAGAPLTNVGLSQGLTAGTTAGSTVGGAATAALAALALGYTIYSGLEQPPTAENITMNAISGAISGAVVGLWVGGPWGALIGAIAGGAIAGGTTGLKAPKPMSTAEKSRKIAGIGASNLANAIDAAASIEDLVTIFNTRWAPHGEVLIMTDYQGVVYFAGDYDDPAQAAATPELMVIPEFLDHLRIFVGETGAPSLRQDLINKFRAKRDQLVDTLAQIPYEILESDRAAGITRRTYLPFQTLYGLEKGKQVLLGSGEFYRRDLGGEDATVAFLLDRLREYSASKDIDISREDFLFR